MLQSSSEVAMGEGGRKVWGQCWTCSLLGLMDKVRVLEQLTCRKLTHLQAG